jgi:hypothetical protein
MIGYWLTYNAGLRTPPDVPDVTPYLTHYTETLRAHPEVADATYQHDPRTHRVVVHVYVRHALTPDFALLRARIAVHESLRKAGAAASACYAASPSPAAQLWIDTWPEAIRRG